MSVLTNAPNAGQVSHASWSINQETCAHLQNHFETLHSKIFKQNWTKTRPQWSQQSRKQPARLGKEGWGSAGKACLSTHTLHWSAASPGTFSLHRTPKFKISIPGWVPDFSSLGPMTECSLLPGHWLSKCSQDSILAQMLHIYRNTWIVLKEHIFCSHQEGWELRGSLQANQPLPSIKW